MRTISILLLTAVVATLAAQAGAAPQTPGQAKIQVCGQLRNGPLNDWALPRTAARRLGLPTRFRGRTWTVLASTSCAFAMQSSRAVLRRWAKTQRGGLLIREHGVRGYHCSKTPTPPGGRGHAGGQCLYLAIGRRFGFYQLGSLSLAQAKRLVARGRLPVG